MNALTQVVRHVSGALRGSRPATKAAPRRRESPRVSRRLAVSVLGCQLLSTSATASGIQVACPARSLSALRARWDPGATPVQVGLPDGEAIDTRCAVTYVSEWGDEYLIGLDFTELDERARQLWHAYLRRLHGDSPAVASGAA